MAELINDDPKIEEAANSSDADSLDSEGYDKMDPYAAQAKQIDRKNKVIMDFHERPLIQGANAIIKSKESMTHFEKKTMKYVLLFAMLGYLIFTNITARNDQNNYRSKSGPEVTNNDSWLGIFSFSVLNDMS